MPATALRGVIPARDAAGRIAPQADRRGAARRVDNPALAPDAGAPERDLPTMPTPVPASPSRPSPALRCAALAGIALALAGCGGGGGGDLPVGFDDPLNTYDTVTGTAATGAPIAGATVQLVSAKGTTATATTRADGRFSVSLPQSGPYLLSVTDSAGRRWYSYAPAGGTANLTPLTTLALLEANGRAPLATLASGWSSSPLTASAVAQAAATVNANLRTPLASGGLDPRALNVFDQPFDANHTGLDGVLDGLDVAIACSGSTCTPTLRERDGNTTVSWSANPATGDIAVQWSVIGTGSALNLTLGTCAGGAAGSVTLQVETRAFGLKVAALPDVCVTGLPRVPGSSSAFCTDPLLAALLPPGLGSLSCSFSGSTGRIDGGRYSVSFTYVQH